MAFIVKVRMLSGLIVLTEMGEEYENVADFVGYLGGGRRLHDSQSLQSCKYRASEESQVILDGPPLKRPVFLSR
jgi:hypothetical protein